MKKPDKWPKSSAVEVRWIDSMGTTGWQKGLELSRMECISVGHLIEKRPDRVIIALNRSHYGDGDYMEIPAVAVKSVRRLK